MQVMEGRAEQPNGGQWEDRDEQQEEAMGLAGKWMLVVPRREGDLIGTKNRGIPRECWDHEGHIVLGDRVIEKTLQRGGWNKIRE